MKLQYITAICKHNGIGIKNSLPWYFKHDMKFFKWMTTTPNVNNTLLMGHNTWKSMNYKELSSRQMRIVSHTLTSNILSPRTEIVKNDNMFRENDDIVWIIGGQQLYSSIWDKYKHHIENVFITYIDKEYNVDCSLTIYDDICDTFKLQSKHSITENNVPLTFYYLKNPKKDINSMIDERWYSFINHNKDFHQ